MYGTSNNGGNYGYGHGQRKPEPPKPTPEWVGWTVFGVIFVLVCAICMPAEERQAVAAFIGWGGKILVVGALVIALLIWWTSTATTEGDAKARGGLAVTAFGMLLLILVVVGVLRGVGFLPNNDANNGRQQERDKAPFGIPFKFK